MVLINVIKNQEEYCKKNKVPMFMPKSGRCWSCGKDVTIRIGFENSSNKHITGCPYCNRSWCN
jgi:DNA-directed RNA polymerase subunit RPC12/RpoP